MTLEESLKKYGSHKELAYRQEMINNHKNRISQENAISENEPSIYKSKNAQTSNKKNIVQRKINLFNLLLQRVESQKSVPFSF
jgi:hypothetical protein